MNQPIEKKTAFYQIKRNFLSQRQDELLMILLILCVSVINIIWIIQDTRPQPDWDSNLYLLNTIQFFDKLKTFNNFHFWESLGTLSLQGRPPLYQLFAIPIIFLFGRSTDSALFVNIIYEIILLVSVFGIGKLVYNGRAGILAALMVASYPPIIILSRIFRVYLSLPACLALSLWLIMLMIKTRSVKISWLFGMSVVFGMLNHPYFLYYVSPPTIGICIYIIMFQEHPKHPITIRNTPKWLWSKLNQPLLLFGLLPAFIITAILVLPWYATHGYSIIRVRQTLASLRQTSNTVGFDQPPSFWWYLQTMPNVISFPFMTLFIFGLIKGILKRQALITVLIITFLSSYIVFSTRTSFAWKGFVGVLPIVALISSWSIFDIKNRLLSIGLITLCAIISILNFSFVTWEMPPWTEPIMEAMGSPLDTSICSRRMFMGYCPDPANNENWRITEILHYIFHDNECKEKICSLSVVTSSEEFQYNVFRFNQVLNFRDESLDIIPIIPPGTQWKNTFTLDWLQSEYVVFVSEYAHGQYSRAVLKLLKDPPEIFRTSHKEVSSFDLPHGWTAKLVVRTKPFSVKEADEIISELNLPNENKVQLIEWLDKYSKERLNEAQRAVKLHPQNPDLWLTLAREYQETGNQIDSLAALEKAISFASAEDKSIFIQAANINRDLGNFEKSTSLYHIVLKTFPDDINAHWGLAQTYDAQGLYDDGFSEYFTLGQLISKYRIPQLGLEEVNSYKHAIINYIDTLMRNEFPQKAYKLATTLIQGNILTKIEKINLASSVANKLINQNKSTLAINTLAHILPDSQNSTAWVILGKAYNKEKKLADAIDAFEQALIFEPKNYWANHLLASIFAKQEKWDLVVQHEETAFSESMKIDWQVNSGLLLVKAYDKTGKKSEACSMIEQLKSLASDDERIEKINKDLLCQN